MSRKGCLTGKRLPKRSRLNGRKTAGRQEPSWVEKIDSHFPAMFADYQLKRREPPSDDFSNHQVDGVF